MAGRSALVGRDAERERLEEALARARLGARLARAPGRRGGRGKDAARRRAGRRARTPWCCGAAPATGPAAPYAPVVASLRSYLRASPDGLDDSGPLRPHLALILPELGDPAPASDRATLFEAVRAALAHLARERLVLLVLDDLQWSDDATLELLAALAEPLGDLPVLVVAGYRSDGLPRDHALRRLRHELRRGGRLDELALGAARARRDRRAAGARSSGTPPRPRWRGRSTTGRRASPSSSRSSRGRCWPPTR